ncbi:MAG: hypothetical protein HC882_00940 [Acidobacteria bacterium]|nr:hypothetical protein [Acidobacteriota bacterium]
MAAKRRKSVGLGSSPAKHAQHAAHELIRAESALATAKEATNCRLAFSGVKAARAALATAGAHMRSGGESEDPALARVFARVERQVVRAEGDFLSACVKPR